MLVAMIDDDDLNHVDSMLVDSMLVAMIDDV